MRSLSHEYLRNIQIEQRDIGSLINLGQSKGKQELFTNQFPERLETLLKAAKIESAESSNRIEGISAPRKAIEKLILQSTEPANRSEEEIAGYRDVLSLIHENTNAIPISVNSILQFHEILYRYHPGKGGVWKATSNDIIEKSSDGSQRVRHRPLSPVETPIAMEDLVAAWRREISLGEIDPLILVPLFVFEFLSIHPFHDGNGRMSRLLTTLLLYHCEYWPCRYVSLERIVEDSKDTYYEALESSSLNWHNSNHDPLPWLRYFWGVLQRSFKEFEQRVKAVTPGRGSKGDAIRELVLRQVVPLSISKIEQLAPGVSRDHIRTILRQMKDEGLIRSTGKGRGAKWALVE